MVVLFYLLCLMFHDIRMILIKQQDRTENLEERRKQMDESNKEHSELKKKRDEMLNKRK